MSNEGQITVVVVGGGFAGVACAKHLATHQPKHRPVKVILIDRHNYSQFQPLLYQVATDQLATEDIATPLRLIFGKHPEVDVKMADVASIDAATRTVTTVDGIEYAGDQLVLAAGGRPNFFGTPGADRYAFPLYSLRDAERLRSRILEVVNDADRDPSLVEKGALNFVIVGGGPTGVETAGALGEMINHIPPERLQGLDMRKAKVTLVDHGDALLAAFSDRAHAYVAKVLGRERVELKLGTGVTEVAADRAILSDGSQILTRTLIWGGGIQAAGIARESGIPQGSGGRIDVRDDLSVDGFEGVYAVGDVANIPDPTSDGRPFPQLGSVAQQSGRWAAKNILADHAGEPRTAFGYHDKGIMAMIGRNAAIAEVGKRRHELHGAIAFSSWLGVHAMLMNGVRGKVDAFVSWGWDYFSKNRAPGILDDDEVSHIDWEEGPGEPLQEAGSPVPSEEHGR
jgi:NADH dehydrogenase